MIINTVAGADNGVCSLPPETGPCRANMQRYYYDGDSNSCKTFTYGGCQGNENNFKTKEDCENKCKE
ncbi:kunitz-type serine protease inhibitor taicotoxin [Nephila pilipes]|uniref:Kunitz-type serine protease inhibitor taicotoxin n=1 Tax=Nephila pilipes TaxID=299642 RepID=A0A8X6T061_NEPPI|nr:kunitz-type serine protease inhibitor taicotoxin [Nephila pilipes]